MLSVQNKISFVWNLLEFLLFAIGLLVASQHLHCRNPKSNIPFFGKKTMYIVYVCVKSSNLKKTVKNKIGYYIKRFSLPMKDKVSLLAITLNYHSIMNHCFLARENFNLCITPHIFKNFYKMVPNFEDLSKIPFEHFGVNIYILR